MILNPEDRKERQGLKNSKRQNRRARRDEQLAELLEDMAGVKIEAEWIKRGVEDETSSTV